MNHCAWGDVVITNSILICKVLAIEDKSNHSRFDSLLLLNFHLGLLNGRCWLEVEGSLLTIEHLDMKIDKQSILEKQRSTYPEVNVWHALICDL